VKIEQKVGQFTAYGWTRADEGGWPPRITIDGLTPASYDNVRLELNDLHDLRYLCDRMISQFEEIINAKRN
jgi:hypothetical protein